MNIFEFALKMELDGEKYYRDLAEKTRYDDLKKVLIGLAEDEKRHYEIIQLAKNQTFQYIEADPSLTNIKNVFADNTELFGEKKEFIAKLKDEQFDYYQAALVKENESVKLYQNLKESVENPVGKAICEELIHEEEKHVEVLDSIIEMLNHVNDWVESAEFNHQDNY
ncbi:rubrerythrin [Sporomusaceae bacterium BoRhaA]|uniref:ferritin family protein n=1 Tax=Pelorhabdus rhamnosifermentans TaxID=2772457 RepID=UPI001C061673|nr:ferritin family protein [Pelorhabdus rhamnosifermentans]MBU2700068.1 rubrerythrin [Pelorhabdus rhamnosifermentans]